MVLLVVRVGWARVDVHFVTVLFFVVGGLWQLSHID
jgi:hypothetical protein